VGRLDILMGYFLIGKWRLDVQERPAGAVDVDVLAM
jgi:hypothetical protein